MGTEKDTNSKKRSAKKRDSGDAMRLCEDRFKSLLDLSSEWYWEQDEDFRFTLITGASFGKTGIDLQQCLGTMRWDHGAIPVGDNGSWEKHKAALEARQPFADFLFRCVDRQGEFRYLSTSGQPAFDGKKRFKGYRGISKDITPSTRTEEPRPGDTHDIVAISRDIRERLAAEDAQQQQVALIAQSAEKDRLLRLFYDLPFVGLAVTSPTSKRWLQVNDYMCEMLGYSREEMMELAWTEITHPDDIPANLALFKRLAAGEFDAFQFDKRFLRKDGGIVDTTMECRCMRRRDGSLETVIIMVQNITERKRSEAALRDSAEQLRLFTDNVPAMTVSYDENLRCSFVNSRYSDFFGFGATEIVGKHLREIVGEDAYSEIEGHFAQVLQGHPVTYYRTHMLPNGESRYLEIKVLPHIADDGKLLGCFSVAADITEHKQTEERIQRVAHHDSLTGLPNRLLFNDRINQAISVAKRGSRQFALLYLDLDKFKSVNDNLGHHAGDELLKSFTERIRHQVRESDTVARIGGDEFTVILSDITSREDAEIVAKKLTAALATPFQLGRRKQSVDIGASIGIAVYPTDAQDADALIKAADAAMYSAKQAEK